MKLGAGAGYLSADVEGSLFPDGDDVAVHQGDVASRLSWLRSRSRSTEMGGTARAPSSMCRVTNDLRFRLPSSPARFGQQLDQASGCVQHVAAGERTLPDHRDRVALILLHVDAHLRVDR